MQLLGVAEGIPRTGQPRTDQPLTDQQQGPRLQIETGLLIPGKKALQVAPETKLLTGVIKNRLQGRQLQQKHRPGMLQTEIQLTNPKWPQIRIDLKKPTI